MAWTNSKIFAASVKDALDRTAAFDLNTDTLKAALYNNSITPDNSVAAANTAYAVGQWAVANEVDDGTNWDTGGEPLTSVTVAQSTTTVTVDAADTPQGGASTTLSGVHGCLVYDDTLTTPVADQGWCYNYFGGAQSVTAGDFTIVWAAAGVSSLDLS
jgi:hypothetical protein